MRTLTASRPQILPKISLTQRGALQFSTGLRLSQQFCVTHSRSSGSIRRVRARESNDDLNFVWDEDLTDDDEMFVDDLFDDENEEIEVDPCLGSVIYQRSARDSVFVAQTTLESLNMTRVSSEKSQKVAMAMVRQDATDEEVQEGTPVFVVLDVEKDGRDLRLEGTATTAMSVRCKR